MKLIVGLGNIGDKYKDSRHNVGFEVVDRVAQESGIQNYELSKKFACYLLHTTIYILAKPTTFMNSSGDAVGILAAYYKLTAANIWVIHDDLDIRLGQYKIQLGVGPKVHGGINSIEEKLGTKEFWRVRIGVDNRISQPITNLQSPISNRQSGDEYVMGKFTKDEVLQVEQIVEKVVQDLKVKLSI